MKKIVALLLAVIMCFGLLVACGESNKDPQPAGSMAASGKKINTEVEMAAIGEASVKTPANVPDGQPRVTGLTIAEASEALVIARGATAKIEYTVKPDTAYDKSVYYVSADENIAKVDKDGNVLAVACGSTDITVATNDKNLKRTVSVIVYQNAGDDAKSTEMLAAINAARVANGQAEFTSDNAALKAAANQRALEEAIDMVNNKKDKMDKERTDKSTTILADYDIWSRASAELYIWGDYSKDTQKAFDALTAIEDNAKALGLKDEAVDYDDVAIGYFVFNDVTYWCILMSSK